MVASQGSARLTRTRPEDAIASPPLVPGGTVAASSMSRIASAMSCSRFRESLRRHRSSSLRTTRWVARQRDPVGIPLEDADEGVGHRVALEWTAAGQHLVEHAPERPDVGSVVDRLTARLLRTHIRRRAEHASVRRAVERAGASEWHRGLLRDRFRQAEVEHFRAQIVRQAQPSLQHDVGRLQVAVDDRFLVRGDERVGDLARDGKGVGERQRSRPRRSASVGPSTNSRTSAVMPSDSSSP